MNQRIQAILGETVGPSVLDVGCTGGLQSDDPRSDSPLWLHRHLMRSFDDVWGIDISKEKIESLHERGFERVSVADAQEFLLDRTFDSIVAGELIEHLENPAQFLRSAARHLRPGGRIVLTTPYAQGLPNVAYSWIKHPRTCSNPEHTMWFCPSTIAVLARRSGLDVVSCSLLCDVNPANRGTGTIYSRLAPAFIRLQDRLPARIVANGMVVVLRPSAAER